jgi:AcrR family transcriptional regulator
MTSAAGGAGEPELEVVELDGRTRRRELNAERLYEAACELLARRPYEELTVDEICEHAGVGRATFFRIFDTKAGLLREFNRRLAQDATARLERAGDVDVRTALNHIREAIIDAWRHAGRGHMGMAAEFTRSVPSSSPHAAHPELLELVVRRITLAVDTGEVPDTVPAELAGSLALIHMTAAVAYAIAGRDIDIDELSRILLDQWYAGMTT